MDLSAKHVGFVVAAYAVAFVLLAALIAGIVVRMRLVQRRLTTLEAQGARRRKIAPSSAVASGEMVEREAP